MKKCLLRKANSEDMRFLFDLRNEKSVREQSFQQKKIALEDHKKWFQKKLKDDYTDIYIYENDGIPVGQVRVDIDNEKRWGIISYAVQREYRGRGLGCRMLKNMEQFEKKRVKCGLQASVKKENAASCRVFEKLGYHGTETDIGYKYVKRWNER